MTGLIVKLITASTTAVSNAHPMPEYDVVETPTPVNQLVTRMETVAIKNLSFIV